VGTGKDNLKKGVASACDTLEEGERRREEAGGQGEEK